jgi:hypothetical protein
MKSTTIKRIVAFLFLSVGILYIVMWLQRSMQLEGFQSSSLTSCSTKLIGGRYTYLCPDVISAESLLLDGTSSYPVCYTNINMNLSNVGSVGYTCYDMNGDPTFDDTRGVYVPFDPLIDNDTMPGNGENDITTGYGTFLAGYNSFVRNYKNSLTLETNISSLGLGNIKAVQTNLNRLSSDAKCQNPTAVYTAPCAAINRALTKVNTIINDNSTNSLSNLSTTLRNTNNTIKSSIYTEFIPGFYTRTPFFMSSPQVADYLANK